MTPLSLTEGALLKEEAEVKKKEKKNNLRALEALRALMEMQESSESEKRQGGEGVRERGGGGGVAAGETERQQLTSQGISQGRLIQCDQRKILIFK